MSLRAADEFSSLGQIQNAGLRVLAGLMGSRARMHFAERVASSSYRVVEAILFSC